MTETVTQMSNQRTLPESWEWTTLTDIGTVASGGTPKTRESSNFDGDIPWITPADLSGYTDKTIDQGKRNISQKGLDSSSARLLPEGTVIFSSRAPVGYVVIAGNPISTNQGCKNLIPNDGVYNEYVYYYLKGSKSLAESYASGTTFLELSAKAFGRLPIPLPPLNEQRRIVEKIEELFTKLDAGVRSLKQAQALLKSYRRSVLKAAVEGELSRGWREAHRNELEPASELLERILQERREKFAGKKYKEPASPDTSKLPALPDGWEWASLEQLSWDSSYGTSSKCGYDFAGPPVLRIPNISQAKVSLEDIKFADTEAKLKQEGKLDAGDLLIIRTNGSRDLIGRAAVVKQSFERDHFFASYLIRYRLSGDNLLYRWVETIWHSHSIRSWMQETAATSAGQYNISVSALNKLVIPLPPQEEAKLIAEEVERRLSVVDKLEATVEENLKQAGGLRQSILKQAFSGELVPQDSDDEPASVLLARIREERQAAKQKAGKKSIKLKRKAPAGGQALELFPEQGL